MLILYVALCRQIVVLVQSLLKRSVRNVCVFLTPDLVLLLLHIQFRLSHLPATVTVTVSFTKQLPVLLTY